VRNTGVSVNLTVNTDFFVITFDLVLSNEYGSRIVKTNIPTLGKRSRTIRLSYRAIIKRALFRIQCCEEAIYLVNFGLSARIIEVLVFWNISQLL